MPLLLVAFDRSVRSYARLFSPSRVVCPLPSLSSGSQASRVLLAMNLLDETLLRAQQAFTGFERLGAQARRWDAAVARGRRAGGDWRASDGFGVAGGGPFSPYRSPSKKVLANAEF